MRPPTLFEFLANLYDVDYPPTCIRVNPVRYGPPAANIKPPRHSSNPLAKPPRQPCILFTVKGSHTDHYHLTTAGSPNEVLPTSLNSSLITTFALAAPTIMTQPSNANYSSTTGPPRCVPGCKHDGFQVQHKACMHSNQIPAVTVSKIGSDRSIPLVENVPMGEFSLGIQYDTDCQINLIPLSALRILPPSVYSQRDLFQRVK